MKDSLFKMNSMCRLIMLLLVLSLVDEASGKQVFKEHGLHFLRIPTRWDEAIPLGNGISGTLIWQKDGNLRLALDRADLWDLRPVKEFSGSDYSYKFVCDAVEKGNIQPVYDIIDARTGKDIAPTKIPAGAIEIPVAKLGEVESVDWMCILPFARLLGRTVLWGVFSTARLIKGGIFTSPICLIPYPSTCGHPDSNWRKGRRKAGTPFPVWDIRMEKLCVGREKSAIGRKLMEMSLTRLPYGGILRMRRLWRAVTA